MTEINQNSCDFFKTNFNDNALQTMASHASIRFVRYITLYHRQITKRSRHISADLLQKLLVITGKD